MHCYIVSDLRFLLEIHDILPKTSPFLSAQMIVLSSFFEMFIVLGIFSFAYFYNLRFVEVSGAGSWWTCWGLINLDGLITIFTNQIRIMGTFTKFIPDFNGFLDRFPGFRTQSGIIPFNFHWGCPFVLVVMDNYGTGTVRTGTTGTDLTDSISMIAID